MTIAPGRSPRKARLALAGAAAVAAAAVFVLFRPPSPPDPPDPATPPAVAVAAEPARATPPARTPQAVEAEPNQVASAPRPSPARESVPEAEALPREPGAAPSVPSGIGLFPPRGSDPVRVGLVVPDDFELPEGFVRHYQVTDDGQDVAPILLVHPDFELLDAAGNPVPRPPGGVVPPELAPPGMPIETVVVPEPLDESAP